MQTNLTTHNTPRKITTTRNSFELGRENPIRKGDNTPQFKAVFLCLSFFNWVEFDLIKIQIMMALFGQSFGLVVPFRDILTPFNAVTNSVRSFGVGFTTQRKGITA